ncbi:MAG: glycosyltransferase [Blastocatellia bacterium]|nr:glycosyltransferase [Blastocatellia bacterium]
MPLQLKHRALYAAFDRFPSQKGAASHIYRMSQTLFDLMQGGLLYALGDEELPVYQKEDSIEILRYSRPVANFLERTLRYGRRLSALLEQQGDSLRLCHFRDPWSGVPILTHRDRRYVTVYEVNGLPSIELPYSYPKAAPLTLARIREAERFCWSEADSIITPSRTIKDNLVRLGAAAEKITVIPNGADIPSASARPADAPSRYIIYFGALQRWQGVDVLLRAFARLADLDDLGLVICSSTHPRLAKAYRKLAEKLGVAERMLWFFRIQEGELAPWRAHALLSVAPLTECSRNLDQGCCPLKILESMASGVPVLASDLPSVREIMTDRVDGRLVRPDRPAELARAIRVLLEYPDYLRVMGEKARLAIEQDFTWTDCAARLTAFYAAVCAEARADAWATDSSLTKDNADETSLSGSQASDGPERKEQSL